jgi:plastocyanin
MRQFLLGGSLIVLTLTGVGCGSSSGSSAQPGINGCTTFTNATAASAPRTINFGGTVGNAYDQKCLAVAPGQSVMWIGSFSAHPLQPGLAPSQQGGADAGSPNNPIQTTNTGTSVAFTFATPGVYPYYCSVHQAQGMFGTVAVLGP